MGDRNRLFLGLLGIGMLAAMPPAGLAAPADTHPDLSGVYQIRPAYSTGTANIKTFDGKPIPMSDDNAAKVKKLDAMEAGGKHVIHNTQMGWPKGFLQASRGRFDFAVVQMPKQLSFFFEEDSQYFMAYIDAKHPDNIKPSFLGDSVAHWEGDTLVIDTVGFNGETPLNTVQVSNKLHTIMKLHLIEGGKALQNDITVEDPVDFTRTWGMTLVYGRQPPGTKLYESVYAENNRNLPDFSTQE